jgi:hypothetical protein
VRLGTARFSAGAYTRSMQLLSIKTTIAIVWVLTVLIGGFFVGNVTSFPSWTALVAIAVLPPLVMMWLWKAPLKSMSERIQEALR